MFQTIQVVGRGRVGGAFAERLRERGIQLREEHADLVLLCVPDTAIAAVAASIAPGPWIAHVSGATPLRALEPHQQRFGLHPLQTFTRARGAEQIEGAWAAVTAESAEARSRAMWLADTLGLRAFEIQDASRLLYHAGAVFASNYLVTLYRSARRLFELAGAPPDALLPLIRRTVDNGFDLTGPIARGDAATVHAHLSELAQHAPDLEALYRALAKATAG
jgi:predicted short-subunit dehydrogenase-like oxidoreductase (DUF2520 family)